MQRWFRGCAWFWGISLIVFEGLLRTTLKYQFPVNLAVSLHPWWYLPVLLLLPLLLVRRRWLNAGLVALISALWLLIYAPRWFPAAPPPAQSTSLRILSWNVWGGNVDAAGILAVIEQEQPDLILLQEVDEGLRQPLAQALRYRYPFYEIRLPTQPGLQPSDLALFSRFPYTPASWNCPYWSCYRRAVVVRLPHTSFTLVNIHIERSPQRELRAGPFAVPVSLQLDRETQTVRDLVDVAAPIQPLIVAGDFNFTEHHLPYAILADQWVDSWRSAGRGLGFTWPAKGWLPPLMRIDYVWHSPDITTTHTHAAHASVSDHRYLVVDLVLP